MPDRKAIWKSDTQFNHGPPTFDKTEVEGSGDSAFIRLQTKGTDKDNVPFTTPGNYTFDPTKIDVVGGKAKLKASVTEEKNWPFATPGNYTYDSAKIAVIGSKAKLKGTPIQPYAWWHLNESSGVTVADSSGNGRDGTLVNMEDADWVAGKLNNCLRFNEGGTKDEYVNCGSIAGFERTDSFSLEFWIKILGPSDSGVIRLVWKYGTTGYLTYVQNNHIYVFLSAGGANRIIVHGDANVQDGSWHHVIITYDGSSLASGVNIYVDGALDSMTIDSDALTSSILTGVTLKLCDATPNYFLNGYLDETVIYEKELNLSEVQERYNSGNGTENAIGAYSTENPDIYPSTGFPFTSNITEFSETATKPANTGVKYQVSSDDGVTWKWWNGLAWVTITLAKTDTWYYDNESNVVTDIHSYIEQLAASGTFRFRAFLHTSAEQSTPELDNVYIGVATYPTGSHEITMGWNFQPAVVSDWRTVTEIVSIPPNTDIKYQYSIDSGSSWNGVWLTKSELELALQGIVCVGDGTDKLRIKFRLSSTSPNSSPLIDNLEVEFGLGYEPDGTYKSYIYYPIGYWTGIYVEKINFTIVTPSGTTVIIEALAVDHVLEEGYKPYNDGDTIGICGACIAWKVTLHSNTGTKTSQVNSVEVVFHILIGTLRTMDSTVNFLRKLLNNRLELADGDTDNWVLFDDDDVTPLLKYDVKDRTGGPIGLDPLVPARRSRGQ